MNQGAVSLNEYRAHIDKRIEEEFSGNPEKLLEYGLAISDLSAAKLVRDAMSTGGKRLRAYLLHTWHDAVGGNEDTTIPALLIELVHAGTLVIDDVQDHSPLRRGKPSLHTVHGEPLAINTGVLMLFMAAHRAQHLPNGQAISARINDQLTELALGQNDDIYWQHAHELDTSAEKYELMARRKTSSMFVLAVDIAQLLAGQPIDERLHDIISDIGLLFQLSDDLLNVKPGNGLGKEYAEDIREQKITAVLIAAYDRASDAQRKELTRLYTKPTVSEEEVNRVLELYDETRARDVVRTQCATIRISLHNRIKQSTFSGKQQALLRALSDVACRT